jgi:hypothetical protein
MPAGFKHATPDDVYKFLDRAATDDDFHRRLETATPKALSKLLRGYGVRIPEREIPPAKERTVPTNKQCLALIATFELDDQHKRAQYDYGSTALAPLMMVVGHAMPLVATIEGEVGAAG